MKMNKKNENTSRKLLGQAIKALRKSKKMTQLDLANSAGSDPGNISRLERGLQGYSDDMLRRVSDALGVSVSTLFSMIEDPKKTEEIAQNYDKELLELKKVYMDLNPGKRRLLMRIAQELGEE